MLHGYKGLRDDPNTLEVGLTDDALAGDGLRNDFFTKQV